MAKKQIGLALEPDVVDALDARAERDGMSRTELIEFAVRPLLKDDEVRVLKLRSSVLEMFDRIAAGQGVHRVDVMARALTDYAGRAAERWQINARSEDRPNLKLIADDIREHEGIRPYEGN